MKNVILQVLKCDHCGRQVFAVADPRGFGQRLSGHKCAGKWTTVMSEEFELATIKLNAFDPKHWNKSDDTVTKRLAKETHGA